MKAQAIRFSKAGPPDVLELVTTDLGDPGPGEARLRQTAVGLNFMDVYHRSGQYPLPVPSGVGVEAAGVVEKTGAGVAGFKAGDRVAYGGSAPGAYADFRNVPADRLVKIPDGISEEIAAAMLMKGMTVEYLLSRCFKVERGMPVLFHAAAGGVGLIAGQWGKALGAVMIGVAGGPEKCKLAREHGYAHVIDRKGEDIAARVKEITGSGVPVVYDSVGKESFEQSLHSLAPRGYFVSFGTTTGAPPPVEAATLQKLGSLYFTRPTLVNYIAKREELEASAAAVFDMLKNGSIKARIDQRYKLSEARRAHSELETGRTTGSSLIEP